MNRRTFLYGLALGTLSAPLAADAQQAANIPRIGFLSPSSLSDPRTPRLLEVFRQGLRELGYAEGQNIAIESRFAEGKWDQLPGLAAELVRVKVDVIVTYTTPATQAAKQATGTLGPPGIFVEGQNPDGTTIRAAVLMTVQALYIEHAHTRWSAEAWPQVKAEFTKALALRSQIRRAGWFIHEIASGVKAVLSGCPPAAASVNQPFAHVHA
jgi:hypothetical protein